MRRNILIILFSLLILSGCLQDPAPIDGINNYHLGDDGKNYKKSNKQKYRQIDSEQEDFRFEDEKITQKKKSFDPYQRVAVENLIPEEEVMVTVPDVQANKKSELIEDFKIDEKDSGIDWNNIFSDMKNVKNDGNISTGDLVEENSVSQVKRVPGNVTMSTTKKSVESSKKKLDSGLQTKKKIIESNKKIIEPSKKNVSGTKSSTTTTPKAEIKKVSATVSSSEKKVVQAVVKSENKNSLCCIVKPTSGEVLTKYGRAENSELDDGMTFKVSDKVIKSSGDGKVIYIDGENSSHKTVIVKHNNGIISSYSYNGSIKTALNKEVKAGQVIGEVADGKNILYFTTRHNGKTMDPEKIMK